MTERRIEGAAALAAEPQTTLVVIGNFDGVHLGHRAVLEASVREAARLGLRPVALTFDPHPSRVLGRGALPVLTTLERKLELFARHCPELTVVVERFTSELAGLAPEQFAEELLAKALGARVVVVGKNFRFGRARSGDLETLARLGERLGFEARSELLRGDAAGAFSSTRIRAALAAGDLALAQAMLGRPHAISGSVVHGDGRGRSIGVPTANLGSVPEALPPHGVYACAVDRLGPRGPEQLGIGAVNVGERPTLAAGFSVEVHVLDFEGDLYGSELRLHLLSRLREERRFAGIEPLKAQIAEDLREARARLSGHVPAAGAAWY